MKYFPFIIIVFVLSSCGPKGTPAIREDSTDSLVHITKAQFDNMKMALGTLQEQMFDTEIKARGTIDVPPGGRAKVSPAISGSVKHVFVQPGDKVRKGQALLSIEGPEIIEVQQSYLEISGQMNYLQSEYERQKALFAENIASEKIYLEAESNYKKALAGFESLKQRLSLLNVDIAKTNQGQIVSQVTLYAPIAGDITLIDADINMVIQPGDVVVEVVDTRQLQLNLSVFEKDILNIKPGQKVVFALPESSAKTFGATVKMVGKAIENTNRTATVSAVPDAETLQILLVGMYIDASVTTSARPVRTLPSDALIVEGNDKFVLLLEKSDNEAYVFRKVPVHTGERKGDSVEIITDEEITPSTVLLVKGVYDAVL